MKFIQFFVMLMMVVSAATATSTWYPYQGTNVGEVLDGSSNVRVYIVTNI